MNRGANHYKAKLNERKVQYILQSKESNADLARLFGVDPRQIGRVRLGLAWKQVKRGEA